MKNGIELTCRRCGNVWIYKPRSDTMFPVNIPFHTSCSRCKRSVKFILTEEQVTAMGLEPIVRDKPEYTEVLQIKRKPKKDAVYIPKFKPGWDNRRLSKEAYGKSDEEIEAIYKEAFEQEPVPEPTHNVKILTEEEEKELARREFWKDTVQGDRQYEYYKAEVEEE